MAEDVEEGGQPSTKRKVKAAFRIDKLSGLDLEHVRDGTSDIRSDATRWPFLLRFKANMMGMGIGVSANAALWTTLSKSSSSLIDIPIEISYVLWGIGVALTGLYTLIYIYKALVFPGAVFVEWKVPDGIQNSTAMKVIYICIAFVDICMKGKLFSNWLYGESRSLSHANPLYQMAIVSLFVGSGVAGANGESEIGIASFAIGLVFQTVVFVTLFQRVDRFVAHETAIRTGNGIVNRGANIWGMGPESFPILFLFIAPPNAAAVGLSSISGNGFNAFCKAFFLFGTFIWFFTLSNIRLLNEARKHFTLSWWAYTFPLASEGIAALKYAEVVPVSITSVGAVTLPSVFAMIVSFFATSILVYVAGVNLHDCIVTRYFPLPHVDPLIARFMEKPDTLRSLQATKAFLSSPRPSPALNSASGDVAPSPDISEEPSTRLKKSGKF